MQFSSFFGRALSADNLSVKTICIDDPIGHFDDMNILGFTDMIRCILEKQDCQILMSTHEEKVYQIMKRKLDPNFYNTSFIRLDNSEKVVWDKATVNLEFVPEGENLERNSHPTPARR